jgi:hypothetical protein
MQNFISVIIVSVLSLLGLVSTEPLTWRLIKVWLPVNVIFVGMLITSMFRYEVFNFVAFIMLPFIFHYNIFDNLPKGMTGANILWLFSNCLFRILCPN